VLVVCERDRREVLARLPAALAARVRTVGLAVAASGDTPRPAPGDAALAGPRRLVFTGNLGYFVNADAIEWWLREVWPLLAARRPELRLVVAGDRPRAGLRRALQAAETAARAAGTVGGVGGIGRIGRVGADGAAGGAGGVTVVESPPDLSRLLTGAMAALAPMRCGSGVPVKILEAWSQGVPVVASPFAAAGTTGVPGEDLLVAASPQQWVEAVEGLLQDPAARLRLADNGRRRLAADYSRQEVKRQLLAAVAAAVSPQAAGGS
ncbi:MAG: glycosyltransferase, partial [Acidobacteria bacterium]|nr:glycosyltransferase [Acidobacteriota bacterium]